MPNKAKRSLRRLPRALRRLNARMPHIRHHLDSYETSLKQKKWVGLIAQEVRLESFAVRCVDSYDLCPSDLSHELFETVAVLQDYGPQNRCLTLILNNDDSSSL